MILTSRHYRLVRSHVRANHPQRGVGGRAGRMGDHMRYIRRRRRRPVQPQDIVAGMLAVAFLLSIAAGAIAQGRGRRPAWISPVGEIQACRYEDGSGDTQTYPCVWDALTMGNRMRGIGSPRFVVYARAEDGGCPAVTSSDSMVCVYTREWWGEHDGD